MSTERNDSGAAAVIGGIAARVIVAALLVLAVFLVAKYAYGFGKSIFYQEPAEPAPGRDIVFTVEEGDTAAGVAENLKKAGVILEDYPFTIQSKLYKVDFVPGEYELNTSMTTRGILRVFEDAENKDAN